MRLSKAIAAVGALAHGAAAVPGNRFLLPRNVTDIVPSDASYEAECTQCCPIIIVTESIYVPTTIYQTMTEVQVSTDWEWTTDFITETTTFTTESVS
jgi:hypothetical protein